MRFVIAFLFALLFFAAPARAQTWTEPACFDTGWFRPNPFGLAPYVNEPTEWSHALVVDAPPSDADLVKTTIDFVSYRVTIECTNVSPAPVGYGGSGWYDYRLGHEPGIYWSNYHLYVAGHGETMPPGCEATSLSAGGGSFFQIIWPGQTRTDVSMSDFDTNTVEITPVWDAWRQGNRRGAHKLWSTVRGGYSWGWNWSNGLPPPGWGSHSPLSYTQVQEVRLLGSVSYRLQH